MVFLGEKEEGGCFGREEEGLRGVGEEKREGGVEGKEGGGGVEREGLEEGRGGWGGFGRGGGKGGGEERRGREEERFGFWGFVLVLFSFVNICWLGEGGVVFFLVVFSCNAEKVGRPLYMGLEEFAGRCSVEFVSGFCNGHISQQYTHTA